MKKKIIKTLFIASIFALSLNFMACAKTEPEPLKQEEEAATEEGLADGEHKVTAVLEGGTGKAKIEDATLIVENGEMTARLVWSSKNYDYMIVFGEKYLNETPGDNSTFTIKAKYNEPFTVIADTTAMSTPHEIEYTLTLVDGLAGSVDTSTEDVAFDLTLNNDINISKELKHIGKDSLSYAKCFSIDRYEGDISLVSIASGERFLLAGEDAVIPNDLPKDIKIIHTPVSGIYLAASSTMDMFVSLDALSNISFSSIASDAWQIEEAKTAMEQGLFINAGKYSAPDYEMLKNGGCTLAIESTMINHTPDVKEKLEDLNIPVLTEYSSYESHPLGRSEWIKLYGEMTGKRQQADEAFLEQEEALSKIKAVDSSEKTVAFFYVSSDKSIVTRKNNDYIPAMIELAGGNYCLSGKSEFDGNASLTMSMEEFYALAGEADYLIYNSSIVGEIKSINDIIGTSELFSSFKAVKEGNVYGTTKNIYQSSMKTGEIILEINKVLSGDLSEGKYIYHVQ